MNPQIIASPLLGCVIGYITNAIAIKMLFRPSKAIYIGRHRLPFTPGLIPKEKVRLAQSVGGVVGEHLLGGDTVEKALLSPEMLAKISDAIDRMIQHHADVTDTLLEYAARYMPAEAIDAGVQNTKATIADLLSKKLIEADVGAISARAITDSVKKKSPSVLASFFGGLVNDHLKQNLVGQLSGAINGYIERHAPEVVAQALDAEAEKLLSTRVRDLIEQHKDKLPLLQERLLSAYERLIRLSLRRALEAVDIAAIVRERIEALDDGDLEKLILGVADRELKAIVYLGALLGFLMGFVNLLFV